MNTREKARNASGRSLMAVTAFRGTKLCLACLVGASWPALAAAQMGPAPVVVSPVVQRDVATGKVFVGTVEPVRTSTVGSAVDERIVEFPVEEGDRVAKGQPLARLRTRTIETELGTARAELELRRQELAELENGSRPEEIDQARAKMLANKARMDYAKKDLERVQRLHNERSAADDELDETRSLAIETEQEYLEAKAAFELVVEGPRAERIAQAQARTLAQEHEVSRLEDRLDEHTIKAPFDGYVTVKHTEVGEWVRQGQAVAEVIDLSRVYVVSLVVEDYVGRLSLGMEARVDVTSLRTGPLVGRVALIVPRADTRSRSFPVKVRVENREIDGQVLLKAGMLAEVTLSVGGPRQALLVPMDAIVLGGSSPLVYAVDLEEGDATKGKARPVPVDLGVVSGTSIQVTGSLAPTDWVVVRGNERLSPGQAVVITETLAPTARANASAEPNGD